jgi:serine/threonine protein kinase
VTTKNEDVEGKTLRDGRYVLQRRLGEGSQGETWEALDNGILREPREDDRRSSPSLIAKWDDYVGRAKTGEARDKRDRVAIKAFRVGRAKEWKDVELAEREAKTLAKLNHPHLPKYIEHFEEDGALYLVMEKIEGKSVAKLREEDAALGHADVVRMLEDIGEALRYLHARSPFIVHRDIKPGNVIRRPDGSFCLVDFGAVRDRLKVGGGSTVVGTFGYMAPEQFQGRASPKSDLYGLGATAIAMLTGREPEDLPHEGLGIDVARALPKSTPIALVRALTAMLIADPDRRVDSIDDALAFLRVNEEKKNKQKSAPPPQPPQELSRKEKRALKEEKRKLDREERKRRRAAAKGRAIPFIPRVVAQIGLLAATIAVWAVVGVAVPLVLTVLSLIFGAKLRAAAKSCAKAAMRASSRMSDASRFLSGYRKEEAVTPEQERASRARVIAVTPQQAQSLAIQEAAKERHRIATMTEEEREAAEEEVRLREEIESERQRLLQNRLPTKSTPPTKR